LDRFGYPGPCQKVATTVAQFVDGWNLLNDALVKKDRQPRLPKYWKPLRHCLALMHGVIWTSFGNLRGLRTI
jgi:hypothetical protein